MYRNFNNFHNPLRPSQPEVEERFSTNDFCPTQYCPNRIFPRTQYFTFIDPAQNVLPRGVQGGVDVPRGDLHAPGEHNLQDIPGPRRDCRDQEICR